MNTAQKSMTTREMHLKRKAMWDASLENHVAYLDAETGLFAEKFLERRCCPACNASDDRFLFHKSGGTYVACTRCEMIYLNPVCRDDVLEKYYRQNHALQGATVSADLVFYTRLYQQGLDAVTQQLGAVGKILDVGCSTGNFLDIAKQAGWCCYGLELNRAEVEVAQEKGHLIQQQLLANAVFDVRFDAITLWDVFEHIKDGEHFLAQARKILAPSGLVFIQSPSRDALAAQILQEKCNMFDGLEHVNLFGRKSLQKLCEKAGYHIASYETVIDEIGVINNYLGYENPYLGYADNAMNLWGTIDTTWIHKEKKGYKFQACIRIV